MKQNDHHQLDASRERHSERVGKMLETGRITADEAERLRCAAGSSQFNEIVGEIRGRHARARLDHAVEDGRLTREDANVLLGRMQGGDHPRFLHRLRRGWGPRSQPASGVDGSTRRDDGASTPTP